MEEIDGNNTEFWFCFSEEMDPELKAAILQMRKYDRILAKKIKKEKKVKRDRIILTNK